MRKMKASGIEWIGEIPESWDIQRIKFICNNRNQKYCESDGDLEYLALENLVSWCGKYIETESQYDVAQSIICYKDDVLFGKLRPYLAKVYLATKKMCCSSEFAVFYNFQGNPNYFKWLFLSAGFIDNVNSSTYGTKMPRANIDYLNNMCIPIPRCSEQTDIASFLDSQCALIDSVTEKTKSSIEEYKKLRQAVITQAVTKGVRGDRPMKDSGIEWIGEIPEEWDFVKITRILKENHPYPIGDGDHGLIKTEDYQDSGIPYLRVQNLGWGTPLQVDNVVYISEERNEQIKNSILRPNDVLFAKTGATIGKTGIIPEDLPISNTTSHIGKITVSDKYSAKFVFYFLSSKIGFRQFWEIAIQKTTRPELSIEETKSIRILLPDTYEEQAEISAFLDEKCRDIDSIIDKKEQFLSDLESYKKSLIYEYVTGKKEVPQA